MLIRPLLPGIPLLVIGLIALAPGPVRAQDPVPLYPENYRVLLENDRVRVIDFRLAKGAKESSHAHPAHVVHVIAPLKIRFTFPDGSMRIREAKPGEILYSDAVTHASENIGENDAHGILVELKGGIPPPANALTAITFIRGLPGREEELKRELLALTGPTLAEPGAYRYDLYQSPVRPNEFVRLEAWKDESALELHKKTPHLMASFEKRRQQGWTTEITLWKRVLEDLAGR